MSFDCYCDYDPPAFFSKTVRRARKPHRCDECRGQILPGEKYEYVSGKWDDFCTFEICEHCIDLRQWVTNNLPCFCYAYGDLDSCARDAVAEACGRAGESWCGTNSMNRASLRRSKIEIDYA